MMMMMMKRIMKRRMKRRMVRMMMIGFSGFKGEPYIPNLS